MPLTFAETPLYYKDAQGNYHRVLSGADMTGYRTASAQDAIDAAQDADIASRAKTDEIGIVITGARPAVAVTAGQYVIVRSSTITEITDGLYTAVNALSPSTDVTAADLTAVSDGGLNALQLVTVDYASLTNNVTGLIFRDNSPDASRIIKVGNLVIVNLSLFASSNTFSWSGGATNWNTIIEIPFPAKYHILFVPAITNPNFDFNIANEDGVLKLRLYGNDSKTLSSKSIAVSFCYVT